MMHILKHLYTKIDFKRSSLHRSAQYPSASTAIQKTTMTTRICLSFILLLTIFSLTSCADDDLLYNPFSDDNAITFGTGSSSRAVTVTDAEQIRENGFGVYAYYTGTTTWNNHIDTTSTKPNFMENIKVSYNSGNWYYTPVKYWPKNSQEKISYFAYGPYIDSIKYISTSEGAPAIAYEIVDGKNVLKTERMWDLVVAKSIDVCGKPKSDTDKTIKFDFKHVNARLTFNARLSKNLASKGSKVYISNIYAYGIYKYARYNLSTDEWTNRVIADSVDFTKRLNFISTRFDNEKVIELTDTTKTNVFKNMAYMFMIPQNGVIRLKFEYYIVDGDSYEKKTAEMTILKNFEGGRAYVLNVTFGSNGITGGEDNDNESGGDSSDLGLGYIEANGGAYYLHHGWIWDYQEDYMFQKTADGKYTLTLGGNPGVFYVLKKQGVIKYTDIYGLSYDSNDENINITKLEFNTTYNITHSSNVTSWSVRNMMVDDVSANKLYKFTFDPGDGSNPEKPTLLIEDIDSDGKSYATPSTEQTNPNIGNQYEGKSYTAEDLDNMTWALYHNGIYGYVNGLIFTNLGNGLHILENIDKLYPFQLYADGAWNYALGNCWNGNGYSKIKMDVPHRVAVLPNSVLELRFSDGYYVENATIIIDFNDPEGPIVTVNGTPRGTSQNYW
jgi:hypothetical protein